MDNVATGAIEYSIPSRGGRRAAQSGGNPSIWDAPFALSVVIPTQNDAARIEPLMRRFETILLDRPLEIIFVDDSTDHTPEIVNHVGRESRHCVRLLHRPRGDRVGGIGGALEAGLRLARAPWVCVMASLLEHPPEVIPQLLDRARETEADLVVASRELTSGGSSVSVIRNVASHGLAKLFLPGHVRTLSDPMSGFFLVRRDAVPLDELRPRRWKMLLEIVTKSPPLRVSDVPFQLCAPTPLASREG